MKKTILSVMIATLPSFVLAADAPSAQPAVQAQPAAKADMKGQEKVASNKPQNTKEITINLSGVTKENRMDIEKLAKDNGAKKASLNLKTGALKLHPSSKGFNKDQFESQLTSKVTGVTVK